MNHYKILVPPRLTCTFAAVVPTTMPMNDLEAILFDLDGVIIDSEPLHEKAFRQTSLHLGRDLTQEEVASLKGTVEEIGAAKLLEYNPAATLSIPQVMEYHNNLYKRCSIR
jgi:beta-phosphoglucomutase-like phosphatase (HAD superfamily)